MGSFESRSLDRMVRKHCTIFLLATLFILSSHNKRVSNPCESSVFSKFLTVKQLLVCLGSVTLNKHGDQPEPEVLDSANGKTRTSMKRSLRHNSKFLRLIRDSSTRFGNKTQI